MGLFPLLLLATLCCAAVLAHSDYYTVLDVSHAAAIEEIEKGYARMYRQHHPDFGGDHAKLLIVQNAFEVLRKDELRAVYQETGHAGLREYYLNNDFEDREKYSFLVDPPWYEQASVRKVKAVVSILSVLALTFMVRQRCPKKRYSVKIY